MGRGLDQKDTGARRRSHRDFRTSQFGALRQARRFDVGLFPLHSPLLRESRLVSFPPLNNMLKFSGCSRLNSGRTVEGETPLPRASLSGPYARVRLRSHHRCRHGSSHALGPTRGGRRRQHQLARPRPLQLRGTAKADTSRSLARRICIATLRQTWYRD